MSDKKTSSGSWRDEAVPVADKRSSVGSWRDEAIPVKKGNRVDIIKKENQSNLPAAKQEVKEDLQSNLPTYGTALGGMVGGVPGAVVGGMAGEAGRKYLSDDWHYDQGPKGVAVDALDIGQEGLLGAAQEVGAKALGKVGAKALASKPGQYLVNKGAGLIGTTGEFITNVPKKDIEEYLLRNSENIRDFKKPGDKGFDPNSINAVDMFNAKNKRPPTPGSKLDITWDEVKGLLKKAGTGAAAGAVPMAGGGDFSPSLATMGSLGNAARSPLALKAGLLGLKTGLKVTPEIVSGAARVGMSIPDYQAALKEKYRDMLGVEPNE